MKKILYIVGTKKDGYTVLEISKFNGDIEVMEKTSVKSPNILKKFNIEIKGVASSENFKTYQDEFKRSLKDLMTYVIEKMGKSVNYKKGEYNHHILPFIKIGRKR